MSENFQNIPSVAVFMVTYNHEKYIRQAVESIVAQKTSFPVKLFIGEDFSTDNTRHICLELKETYPEKIELLLSEKNVGALKNAFRVYAACIAYGKYTAICEGDDYWTDKNKLQRQVDFLEQNPDFNICCHRAKILNEKNRTLKTLKAFRQTVFTQEDVANHNFLQTLTEVFRNSAWQGLTDGYFQSISGDYFINMMLSENGKIKYLPDVMAVYRQHTGGSWHSLGAINGNQNTLSVLNYYRQTPLREKVKENLNKNIVRHYLLLYNQYKKIGNDIEARNMLLNILCLSPEFLSALDEELFRFTKQQNIKEVKIGNIFWKPYIAFRVFLSKITFFIHRLKYD